MEIRGTCNGVFASCVLLCFTSIPLFAEYQLNYEVAWRYRAPSGGCEICCYDARSRRLFVTVKAGVDVLDPMLGKRLATLPVPAGFKATSVATSRGCLAIAWAAEDKSQRGRVQLFRAASLERIAAYPTGFHPDMLVFTSDGNTLLVANEGEPSDDYSVDRPGSISIFTKKSTWETAQVTEAKFDRFNSQRAELIARGVRIFGPSNVNKDGRATVAEDLEPEYIAVSNDNRTAWITLQENNAIAELDIAKRQIVAIHPLGAKHFHHVVHNASPSAGRQHPTTGLDASDRDGGARIRHWPVAGMYQPDALAVLGFNDQQFLLTANEGEPRKYETFSDALPAGMLETAGYRLDAANRARHLLAEDQLGRLEVSTVAGDEDTDGDLDVLHCFGARSFSIWRIRESQPLELVYDSGNDFEQHTARLSPHRFNADKEIESASDVRSTERGPEPEGIALARIGRRHVAAIGLERTGGVMFYDVTLPTAPEWLAYIPPLERGGLLDLAPEGLLLLPAEQSPCGKPMLIVCHEASGTTTAYVLQLSDREAMVAGRR